MKHLKKFNEDIDEGDFEDGDGKVFVKDIIEYLNQLDPNMEVFLDKDGWEGYGNGVDIVKQSGLFQEFNGGAAQGNR
jgi:hypothetical protein